MECSPVNSSAFTYHCMKYGAKCGPGLLLPGEFRAAGWGLDWSSRFARISPPPQEWGGAGYL
jgi:hypothetical protein